MKNSYVLAIDQSTQGTKAILFDKYGCVVCRSDVQHQQYVNEKGWISHDLKEIYRNTILAVKMVVKKSGIEKDQILCLGISNQRETSAAWFKDTGIPVQKAVVWQCSRAENICENVRKAGKAEIIRQRTGIHLSPYFPASKFAWLKETIPNADELIEEGNLCFGTIDTWLLFCLTHGEVYATDYSNASRTQLYNIHTLDWDNDICQWFGIKRSSLPTVLDSSAMYGVTDFDGFLSKPIPIYGVIGDSQGALFGQGCVEKGMVKATYGTGTSVMMNIGNEPLLSNSGLVTSIAWGINGTIDYVLEGNINYTGAVITWLIRDLNLVKNPGETEKLAYEANKQDTTYLVPAFSGLGAPYWAPDARALLCGMSRITGKCEIVKAAVESIAYQIADVIGMMKEEYSTVAKRLCVDGGPTQNHYLMEFQSNILGIPVVLPKCEESSAQGAAFLAGLKAGFFEKEKIFSEQKRSRCLPTMTEEQRKMKYCGWKSAIEKVL